ncbi:ATP-binding cassette sub-family A member 3-like isoform X2 [Diaphorina citri]|nr:ATP-binding cassette sub-family A member 3-like isoform X2 [Diaphorina citri]
MLNITTGAMGFLIVMIMEIPPLSLKKQGESVDSYLIYFPHYALCSGIRNIYFSHEVYSVCNFSITKECFGWDGNYYSWKSPGISRNLTYLFILGLVFHTLLLSIEYMKILWLRMIWFKNRYCKIFNRSPVGHDMTTPFLIEDSDVQLEKILVKKSNPEDYAIYINDLVKRYNGVEAVKGIDLALNSKECFGLLGSNGAGKSSTFKMLTGDTLISSGNAYICNKMIKTSMNKVRVTLN